MVAPNDMGDNVLWDTEGGKSCRGAGVTAQSVPPEKLGREEHEHGDT